MYCQTCSQLASNDYSVKSEKLPLTCFERSWARRHPSMLFAITAVMLWASLCASSNKLCLWGACCPWMISRTRCQRQSSPCCRLLALLGLREHDLDGAAVQLGLVIRCHRRLRALHQRGDQVAREARADGLHRRGVEAVIEQREVQSPQYAAHPLHLLRQSLELGRRHTPRREEQWRTAKQHRVPCAVQQPAALPHQILALRDSDGGSHLDEGGAARVALDVHLRHQRLHGRLLCFTKGGRLPVQQRLPGPVICAARRRLTLRCTCGIRGASQAPGYLAHAPRKRAGGTQVGQGGAARGKGLLRSGARRQHHAQQHAERHACNDARQAGARHPQRLGVVLDAPKHQAEGDGQQLGGVVVAPLEGELPEGGVQHHGGAGHEEPGIGGHARHPHRDGAARQRACYALQPLLHCLAQHRLRRHDDRDRRPLTAL
mmetsp:Transcript_43582/g.109316  ORF Transcript_43582/g.109316 Transcript_43582/m.109316 type:complete len:431 (+) Transcript_43582:78-1370(+)